MSNNNAINFRDSALVRETGMSVLVKELGVVGATYFIRQFKAGRGDYTTERDALLHGITLEDIIKDVRKIDA